MKLPEGGAFGRSSYSAVLLDRFFAGRASAVLRNSRKEVLPELAVPTMRILRSGERWGGQQKATLRTHLKGVGSFLRRTLLGLLMVLTALLA